MALQFTYFCNAHYIKKLLNRYLLHGTEDLSHEQSIAFHQKLQSLGVHSEIEIYEGKPHAWFNREPDRKITTDRMIQFLVSQFNLT